MVAKLSKLLKEVGSYHRLFTTTPAPPQHCVFLCSFGLIIIYSSDYRVALKCYSKHFSN